MQKVFNYWFYGWFHAVVIKVIGQTLIRWLNIVLINQMPCGI
jgi:hypothetical protein